LSENKVALSRPSSLGRLSVVWRRHTKKAHKKMNHELERNLTRFKTAKGTTHNRMRGKTEGKTTDEDQESRDDEEHQQNMP